MALDLNGLKALATLAKRLILDDWLGLERASANWKITILKIQTKICKNGSKDRVILINYLHLKFKPWANYQNNYQKYLSGAVTKNICSENFLQIIINASVAAFIFSKTRCF